ncbi:hypothetical protein [Maioricimonas sp. JC845]|uniref:hypothetical protein n=1 Tax=Maioricimonas sp. JC845 TaxID=3232138 RepID=UPI003458578D
MFRLRIVGIFHLVLVTSFACHLRGAEDTLTTETARTRLKMLTRRALNDSMGQPPSLMLLHELTMGAVESECYVEFASLLKKRTSLYGKEGKLRLLQGAMDHISSREQAQQLFIAAVDAKDADLFRYAWKKRQMFESLCQKCTAGQAAPEMIDGYDRTDAALLACQRLRRCKTIPECLRLAVNEFRALLQLEVDEASPFDGYYSSNLLQLGADLAVELHAFGLTKEAFRLLDDLDDDYVSEQAVLRMARIDGQRGRWETTIEWLAEYDVEESIRTSVYYELIDAMITFDHLDQAIECVIVVEEVEREVALALARAGRVEEAMALSASRPKGGLMRDRFQALAALHHLMEGNVEVAREHYEGIDKVIEPEATWSGARVEHACIIAVLNKTFSPSETTFRHGLLMKAANWARDTTTDYIPGFPGARANDRLMLIMDAASYCELPAVVYACAEASWELGERSWSVRYMVIHKACTLKHYRLAKELVRRLEHVGEKGAGIEQISFVAQSYNDTVTITELVDNGANTELKAFGDLGRIRAVTCSDNSELGLKEFVRTPPWRR